MCDKDGKVIGYKLAEGTTEINNEAEIQKQKKSKVMMSSKLTRRMALMKENYVTNCSGILFLFSPEKLKKFSNSIFHSSMNRKNQTSFQFKILAD